MRAKSAAATAWLFATTALVGCASETGQTPPPPCVEDQSIEFGLLQPELEAADGTIRGLDLDGRETEDHRDDVCNWTDWPDPDGSLVDAQSAELAFTLSAFYDVDERSFFLGSRFPLIMERLGEDVCAGAVFSLPGGPRRVAEWNGSTFRAYGLGSFPLLVRLPGVTETVILRDVAVRVTVGDDGRMASVIVGGALNIEELVPIGRAADPLYSEDSIRLQMQVLADLRPGEDGWCTEISTAIEALP